MKGHDQSAYKWPTMRCGTHQLAIDMELQVDRSELGLSYRGKGATKMNNALIIHAVFARL